MSIERPLPVITEQNREFWQAAARHEPVLPHCRECAQVFFPIAPVCPFCFSESIGVKRVSGKGKVSSFVIFHQAFYAFHRDRVPYAVVQVELEEGPRVNANMLDIAPADIRIGMPVEMSFEKASDEITLPQFRPAAPAFAGRT